MSAEKTVRAQARKNRVRIERDSHEIRAVAPKGYVFCATEAHSITGEEWPDLKDRMDVRKERDGEQDS